MLMAGSPCSCGDVAMLPVLRARRIVLLRRERSAGPTAALGQKLRDRLVRSRGDPAIGRSGNGGKVPISVVSRRSKDCPQNCLLDYLVGASKHRWLNCDAKLLRGLQVNYELELSPLFSRQLA